MPIIGFNPAGAEFSEDLSREMRWLGFRDGVYGFELLTVAVRSLDFFSWLAKSPADAPTIEGFFDLAQRPADVMLTLFLAMGLVERRGDVFHIADAAWEILGRHSSWLMSPCESRFVFNNILHVLRTDKPSPWARGEKPWSQMMEGSAFAKGFTNTMDSRGLYLGPTLAKRLDLKECRRLLDIAGGSGIYSCCIVALHPYLHATVFEKPPVDGIASKCIADRGCSEQVDVSAGDMFSQPLPHGYDVHLWSNVLHDWDTPAVEELLRKSFDALPGGGVIIIHDMHINRDKTGPLPIALHSVFLMAATEGRCHSIGDMEGLLTGVGFTSITYCLTVVNYSIIMAHKPGSVS